MSWRDQLNPGSINQIPFFTEEGDNDFGIRAVQHEYPLKDEPYIEVMGKKKRVHSIRGFLIGEDYMDLRDRLIVLAESGRTVQLVHHFLGRITVIVIAFRPSESTREYGQCRFTLEVIESGEKKYPTERTNTPGLVLSEVNKAYTPILEAFEGQFDLSLSSVLQGHAAQLMDNLDAGFSDLIGQLPIPASALNSIVSVGEAIASGQSPLSALSGQLSATGLSGMALTVAESALLGKNPVTALMSGLPTPRGMIDSMMGAVSGTGGLLSRVIGIGYRGMIRSGALDDLGTWSNLFGGSPVAVNQSTGSSRSVQRSFPVNRYPSRPVTPLRLISALEPVVDYPATSVTTAIKVKASENQAAFKKALDQLIVVEQARISTAIEYPTEQEAIAVRDHITSRLIKVAKESDDDGVYHQMQQLRVAVHKDITERGSQASAVKNITPGATLPALVLAYQQHGNATREDEIIQRNPRLPHPGFIPGGEPLEVLSE